MKVVKSLVQGLITLFVKSDYVHIFLTQDFVQYQFIFNSMIIVLNVIMILFKIVSTELINLKDSYYFSLFTFGSLLLV